MHWLPNPLAADGTVPVTIPANHPFVRDGFLLPSALIEYLAQAAALTFAATSTSTIKRGLLVAIKDFTLHHPIPVDVPLTLRATRETTYGPLTSALLTAHHRHTLLAQAHMTFHLTQNP